MRLLFCCDCRVGEWSQTATAQLVPTRAREQDMSHANPNMFLLHYSSTHIAIQLHEVHMRSNAHKAIYDLLSLQCRPHYDN